MKYLFVAAVFFLGACSAIDRPELSDFVPTENGFHYTADTNLIYGHSDPEAENTRLEWLEKYLKDNNICNNGYEITKRNPVLRSTAFGVKVYRVHYFGKCL